MRVRSSRVALLSLPILVHSVSLSDFSPRADNLPTDCQALYVQQIDGCQASDFTSSAGCSASCVNALEDLVWPIKSACGDEGLTGENVIVAYLANQGPSQLCHDAPTVIASEVAASSAAEQSTATGTLAAGTTTASTTSAPTTSAGTSIQFIASTTAQPTSTSTTATSDADTSSTITTTATITMATLSPTQSASDSSAASAASSGSVTTTSTVLMVDTSSPPTLASATVTQTTTSVSGSSQTSNSGHSGGGSPFDSNGNVSGAASLHNYGSIAAVGLAVALGAWVGMR